MALTTAGYAAASVSKDVAPFAYTYRFTSVTLVGSFTLGSATATTSLHLSALPKIDTLRWYGKHGSGEGTTAVILRVAGTYTYAGLDDPSCNGTIKVDQSHWARPGYGSLGVANARNAVVTHPTISVGIGEFVLASTYPARGGGCEQGKSAYYEGGAGDRPLAILGRPGFSITDHRKQTFDDGSRLEWTVKAKIKKIALKPIDCSKTPFC